jgi:hypothetical protein
MALPDFSDGGDLPEGVHRATLEEITERFGGGHEQRKAVTLRLIRIYQLAVATGQLERFIIFGSYITRKPEPNDVDIVLVMHDDFELAACDAETGKLFEHTQAEREFGASVFWIRASFLLLETVDEFISYWQIKRDRSRRGIVEVTT